MTNEEIFNLFSKERDELDEMCNLINRFQKNRGYEEIHNITVYFDNSLVKAQKYLKDQNIKVNQFPDNIFLQAYIFYLREKLEEATNNLYIYKGVIETIYISKEATIKNFFKSFVGKYDYCTEYYDIAQNYIKKYKDLGEEIYNLSIEKDLYTILDTYIDKINITTEAKLSLCSIIKKQLIKVHEEELIYKINEKELKLELK